MFEERFCSSPWLHITVNNSGEYEYCRWAVKGIKTKSGIQSCTPIQWFQLGLAPTRKHMLDGDLIPWCNDCRIMENNGKVSGRQKQLLKTGIVSNEFIPTALSTPWYQAFKYSSQHLGHTTQFPTDWQIDLGNFCNSACVFCSPESSSRVANEHVRLKFIDQLPKPSWTRDPALIQKLVNDIATVPNDIYLHFIGGETLITPAFKTILTELISLQLNQRITIGFTTNLTVFDDDLVDLLKKFKQVNLGMSIECLHPVNDYIRYGGKLETSKKIMLAWQQIAADHDWLLQLRVTPTLLSILHLDTIFYYAQDNNISVESCNFLNEPAFMRPSVLPMEYRKIAIDRLKKFTQPEQHPQVINIRHPGLVHQQLNQDALSYCQYLESADDETHRLPDLVNYLKKIESIHQVSILTYLPEYEKLFRSAGY